MSSSRKYTSTSSTRSTSRPVSFDAVQPRCCATSWRARPTDRRRNVVVVVDQGVLERHPRAAGADRRVRAAPPHGAEPGGARARRARRRSGQERPAPRGRHPSRHPRRRPLPAFVRRGGRRRRRARRRGLRGGHGASRHPSHPRADDGARAGRLGGGREERHQRLREEELPRHVRAAVRGHQRLRVPRDALRSRLASGVSEAVKAALIRDARSSTSSRSTPPRSSRATAGDGAGRSGGRRRSTCAHIATAAIRSSSARRGRSTSATGRRTSSSS